MNTHHFCSRACFNSARHTLVQKKIMKTCHERYGGTSPFASNDVQKKIMKTMINRYNVRNPAQSHIIRNRQRQTVLKRYGTVILGMQIHVSRIERSIIEMLEQLFDDIKTQVHINNAWYVDAYVPSIDAYVEIDGYYWHRLNSSVLMICLIAMTLVG